MGEGVGGDMDEAMEEGRRKKRRMRGEEMWGCEEIRE